MATESSHLGPAPHQGRGLPVGARTAAVDGTMRGHLVQVAHRSDNGITRYTTRCGQEGSTSGSLTTWGQIYRRARCPECAGLIE